MSDTEAGPPEPGMATRQRQPRKVSTTSKEAAEQRLAQIIVEQKMFKAEQTKKEDPGDWYVECASCRQPAVFLTKRSTDGQVGANDWFSAYRDGEGPWMSTKIWCQNCKADQKAHVNNDYSFVVPGRQIVSPTDRERRQKEADLLRKRHVAMKQVVTLNEPGE